MGTTQRAGGNTVVPIVEHKIIEAFTASTWQTEAVLLTTFSTIRNASTPVVLITSPALATDLDDIEVGIYGTVTYDFHLLVILKEHCRHFSETFRRIYTSLRQGETLGYDIRLASGRGR